MKDNIKENSGFKIKKIIPEIYKDRVNKNNSEIKDILDSTESGIYRFYSISLENGEGIGYIKYHILFELFLCEIDRIEISPSFQQNGYGTLLLEKPLNDLIADFPYINVITFCSTSDAKSFYQKNDFIPYFGDNNLRKKL